MKKVVLCYLMDTLGSGGGLKCHVTFFSFQNLGAKVSSFDTCESAINQKFVLLIFAQYFTTDQKLKLVLLNLVSKS
jgi:hypothetical protein